MFWTGDVLKTHFLVPYKLINISWFSRWLPILIADQISINMQEELELTNENAETILKTLKIQKEEKAQPRKIKPRI